MSQPNSQDEHNDPPVPTYTHQTTNPITPAQHFPHTIRRLLQLGNSYAVTVPTSWVRKHLPRDTRYIAIDMHTPGQITIHAIGKPPRHESDT